MGDLQDLAAKFRCFGFVWLFKFRFFNPLPFWQSCYVPGDLVVVAEGERDILGGVASLLIALLLLLEFALWIEVV